MHRDFDPDPVAVAGAHRREQRFLADQGFIPIKTDRETLTP